MATNKSEATFKVEDDDGILGPLPDSQSKSESDSKDTSSGSKLNMETDKGVDTFKIEEDDGILGPLPDSQSEAEGDSKTSVVAKSERQREAPIGLSSSSDQEPLEPGPMHSPKYRTRLTM